MQHQPSLNNAAAAAAALAVASGCCRTLQPPLHLKHQKLSTLLGQVVYRPFCLLLSRAACRLCWPFLLLPPPGLLAVCRCRQLLRR